MQAAAPSLPEPRQRWLAHQQPSALIPGTCDRVAHPLAARVPCLALTGRETRALACAGIRYGVAEYAPHHDGGIA